MANDIEQSEKDFFNLVEDLSIDFKMLRGDFAGKIKNSLLTESELKEFFDNHGYTKISVGDCKKIIAAMNANGRADTVEAVLKY